MGARKKKALQVISGWDAVEVILKCAVLGFWQLVKICFVKLWKGHRRKSYGNNPPVELAVDYSIGTHCYIKVMGVKYHYVEAGPKSGNIILVLGDAPNFGLLSSPIWTGIVRRLVQAGFRVVSLDLRGTGGSEGGTRVDLSPPRVVEELSTLLEALGVSDVRPAVIIGQGVGGMLAWYLVHSFSCLVSQFVVIDAPHPSLYWQYPPAPFCQDSLHFIQWPYLPERWLADSEVDNGSGSPRWSNTRACDWSGALNYVRGSAWWRISDKRAEPPALLVGRGASAAQLVASAERCKSPTLRLVSNDQELLPILLDFLVASDKQSLVVPEDYRIGIMGRVLGAVAGRGRELSARLLPVSATA